jgi:glycosyltransferase involved in cell wall biosynthesis
MNEIKKYDFISIQPDYWDSPWQNRHGFLQELSKTNRIFFLSPPFYIVDLIQSRGKGRTKLSGFSTITPNLYSYVPQRYLPLNYRFETINKFVETLRENSIRKKLMELKFKKPVLIIWHPYFLDMIGKFKESLTIYYKYDHYSGYIDGDGKISPKERMLLEKVDMVLVTSQGLYNLHENDCNEIHFVPNGVDYEKFSESLTNKILVAHDIENIPQPRLGYVGVINEKVDFKLLTYLCKSRPQWSIVLVGPVKVQLQKFKKNLEELQNQKNCYFLGKKENKQVPSYIKGLDVCMMCYLVNEWTYYGYPLKMHEYLACGKPTVSADLPEVRPFENVITIAKDKSRWVTAIEDNLQKDSKENISKRLNVAYENSWGKRVNKVLSLIKAK